LASALIKKKGVPSAVGFPHCAGSGEGLFLSPKPYPHKSALIITIFFKKNRTVLVQVSC